LVKINSDFKDLLQLLGDGGVRFLVVGGYAVMKYTEPYHTKDLDIWIEPAPENANRVLEVLRRFGAPGHQVTVDDLTNPDLIYQIGVEPVRVDIMSGVSGLKFEEAWEHRVETDYGGVVAPVLSIDDIIAAKKATGRAKDRIQARELQRAKSELSKRSPG
jgi:predicted nucleotidyltransferase